MMIEAKREPNKVRRTVRRTIIRTSRPLRYHPAIAM
jgi:hypothetical protein